MITYRILVGVKPTPNCNLLVGSPGAFVNVYFQEHDHAEWKDVVVNFLEYYGFEVIEIEGEPTPVELNSVSDCNEKEAILSSVETGFPRYGCFHTYSQGEC